MAASDSKTLVKCVVWDLDHTLWDGILLEDRNVALKPGVVDVIRTLDERGILHSIASRNEPDVVLAKLHELGVADYFLYPQIHWNAKSGSVRAISEALNIGLDTMVFVDDQPFERDEVRFALPTVRCIDAADAPQMTQMPELMPPFLTEDSRTRRHMYLADAARKEVEAAHVGSPEAFLASLRMRFTIAPAKETDLQRAEELTVRTNQLNATGYTYSYEELDRFRTSPDHELLIAGLDDKYGTYGKIGLAVIERSHDVWVLKLLLMSCRVVSRGVGTVFLNHLIRRARDAGVRLQAEFVSTARNRMMYVTYKFAGFKELRKEGAVSILENDYSRIQADPGYFEIVIG